MFVEKAEKNMESIMENNKTKKYVDTALIFVILYTFISRFIYPNLDPPTMADFGLAWSDEAINIHDARIRVLKGAWMIDNTHSFLYGPIYSYIHYICFLIFGKVSTFTMRFPEMLMGTVSIAIFYFTLRKKLIKKVVILLTAALAANYGFTMLNRIALHESTMLLWTFLTLLLVANLEKHKLIPVLLGLMPVMVYFTKASGLQLLASIPIFLIIRYICCSEKSIRNTYKNTLFVYGISFLVSSSILAYLVIGQNYEDYFYRNFLHKAAPLVMQTFMTAPFINIIKLPFSRFFITMPLISVLFFMGLGYFLSSYHKLKKWDDLILYSVISIMVGFSIVSIEEIQPLRLMGFFTPFIFVIVAFFLEHISGKNESEKQVGVKNRLVTIILGGAFFYISYCCTAVLIRTFSPNKGLIPFSLHYKLFDLFAENLIYLPHIRAIIGGSIVVLSVIVLYFYMRYWRIVLNFIAGNRYKLLAASIIIGIFQTSVQLYQANDSIYQASIRLKTLVQPGSVILGNSANVLALDSGIYPLWWTSSARYGNYDIEKLEKWDIDYILLSLPEEYERGNSIFKSPTEFVRLNTGTFLDQFDEEVARFEIYTWLKQPWLYGLYKKKE